jgi:hypothetical protein
MDYVEPVQIDSVEAKYIRFPDFVLVGMYLLDSGYHFEGAKGASTPVSQIVLSRIMFPIRTHEPSRLVCIHLGVRRVARFAFVLFAIAVIISIVSSAIVLSIPASPAKRASGIYL